MNPRLLATGTALPPVATGQDRALELARAYAPDRPEVRRALRVLHRRSGVRRRHSVVLEDGPGGPEATQALPLPTGPEDPGPGTARRMTAFETLAPGLASAAAHRALERSGLAPASIRHLVVVTCTGFFAPGIDVALVRDLELRPDTHRLQIGFMGCHGALVGLRTAARLAAAGPVLLVAVELCSLHFQYGWEPETAVANVLFADGAAAAVVAEEGDGPTLAAAGSWLDTGGAGAMTWRVGDHGFRMTLSAEVPRRIRARLAPAVVPWLEAAGVPLGEVGAWAVHPGGPRILDAAAAALGLGPGALAVSREVLASHGNMSSPTVLFVLEELTRRGEPLPWVTLAFGPGLTTEALLLA